MRCGRWSDDELDELRRRYPTDSTDAIAADLGRGRAGVATKANDIGLRKAGKRPWTDAELEQIGRRYANEPAADIARDIDRSLAMVYYRARQMGIKKSADFLERVGKRPRAPRKDSWTDEQLDELRRRYPHERTIDIAADLGRSYASTNTMAFNQGLHKTEAYMREQIGRFRDGGREHRIKPGAVPPNKGKKMPPGWGPGRMKSTQFPKGNIPENLMQIGDFRFIKADQYWWIKVSMRTLPVQRRWLELHKFVWMQTHGVIPDKHVIRFIDGQKTIIMEEVTADRLECISMAENMRRNTIHNLPKEMVDVIQQKGRLTREINKQQRRQNEKHD